MALETSDPRMTGLAGWMRLRCRRRLLALLLLTAWSACGHAVTIVRVETTLGDVDLEMLTDGAPLSVANFLRYVRDTDYDGSFLHRAVPGFVVQGGGFKFSAGGVEPIPTDPPVQNEFSPSRSNLRGTVAMAKRESDPDSATSQWFVNLADNSGILDGQNGGFTVFARVTGDGMAVIDAIAALQIVNAGAPFDNLPVNEFDADTVTHPIDNAAPNQLVVISRARVDTDGDGTFDGDDPDDDGDGMSDAYEIDNGLDPLDASDRDRDDDGDGLTNFEEFTRGTRADSPDTDRDGKTDAEEVAAGRNPTVNESVLGIVLFFLQ